MCIYKDEISGIFTIVSQIFTCIFVNNAVPKYLCVEYVFTNRLYITEVNRLNAVNIKQLNIRYNVQ